MKIKAPSASDIKAEIEALHQEIAEIKSSVSTIKESLAMSNEAASALVDIIKELVQTNNK